MIIKLIKKNAVRILALCICASMGFTLVGCKNSTDKDSKKTEIQNFVDVRTSDIVNQQQALLRFTTANKAGSVHSVELKLVEDKYMYTVDAVAKNKNEVILTIDGKTGKVVNTKDNGPVSESIKGNYIDFVPVMDVDKAADSAIKNSKNKYIQVLGYKLFGNNGTNVYKFTLGNGDSENVKTETIYIDGVTGKLLDQESITEPSGSSNNSGSTTSGSNSNTTTEN